MSGDIGARITEFVTLSDDSATTLYAATSGATRIVSIVATENSGSTPDIVVDIFDGTNAYRRFSATLLVGEIAVDDTEFILPQNWSLRATSSDASGLIDVQVTYEEPSAQSRR